MNPIPFHQTRVLQSQTKAMHPKVVAMEHQSHTTLVLEYEVDMLYHLLSLDLTSLPSLPLIEQQPDIKLSMRPLLLDFLLEVITMLNLNKSTFPLTVNLIDRYCSTRIVKKQHYQLLGLSCLWIATKFQDSKFKIPNLNDLKIICVNSYYNELFIEMEKHILKSLEWKISCSTFDSFIDIYCKILNINDYRVLMVANFFGDLFQFYPNIYFSYNSSQLGLISLLITLTTLNINDKSPMFVINTINSILHSDSFTLNGDLLKLIKESDLNKSTNFNILTHTQYHTLFNKLFFKNLIKILNNLPKSLKIKYNNKSIVNQLIPAIINNLSILVTPPQTPKVDQVNWPLTPISNIASPMIEKKFNYSPNFDNIKSSTNFDNIKSYSTNLINSINYLPNSPKKRSFDFDNCQIEKKIKPSSGFFIDTS